MFDQLKQVGANGPDCAGKEIFQMYMRKEITFDAYLEANAVSVAENPEGLKPKPFTPLPAPLYSYCNDRMRGLRKYEPETGKRLGLWVLETIKTHEDNKHNAKILLWAEEKLAHTRVSLTKLKDAIVVSNINYAPMKEVTLAMKIQSMDMIERDYAK
jgi:hypothetical protein